jgi:hypothetical protein
MANKKNRSFEEETVPVDMALGNPDLLELDLAEDASEIGYTVNPHLRYPRPIATFSFHDLSE